MLLFKRIEQLQNYLDTHRAANHTIGFAPTMGALHLGHISLINEAKKGADVTVCSIFVNPTQFNDPNDLAKYPRTIAADIELLEQAGTDVLFLPDVSDMYPNGTVAPKAIDFGDLERVMEGAMRPGHFAGVAQVVGLLLDAVKPDSLYMGQKDFQQVAIVRHMLSLSNSPVQLVMCATVREPSGLAMSSRNIRLSEAGRNIAANISRILAHAATQIDAHTPAQVQAEAITSITEDPNFRLEYFEIADAYTLQPIYSWHETDYAVACVALWLEGVRLIDNMILYAPNLPEPDQDDLDEAYYE